MNGLTNREIEVLWESATGETNAEVAHRLGITEQTVKNHLQGAYRKLHVRGKVAAYVAIGWLRPR